MTKTGPLSEELELNRLREQELDLFQHAKEVQEHHRRIQIERAERESTIPPMDDIGARRKHREHELAVSRGDVKNKLKEQSHSFLLLVALSTATAALMWWGWTLMQGT
jgi:hypothetical protein